VGSQGNCRYRPRVVQAYPEACEAAKKNKIKVIYGIEAYLLDDSVPIVYHANGHPVDGEFVVFDIETTGLSADKDKITEIGAVKIKEGKIVDTFSTFVNPEIPIPEFVVKLTGITDDMVSDAPTIDKVLPEFLEFVGTSPLVAHNAVFDTGFSPKIPSNSLRKASACWIKPESFDVNPTSRKNECSFIILAKKQM